MIVFLLKAIRTKSSYNSDTHKMGFKDFDTGGGGEGAKYMIVLWNTLDDVRFYLSTLTEIFSLSIIKHMSFNIGNIEFVLVCFY